MWQSMVGVGRGGSSWGLGLPFEQQNGETLGEARGGGGLAGACSLLVMSHLVCPSMQLTMCCAWCNAALPTATPPPPA